MAPLPLLRAQTPTPAAPTFTVVDADLQKHLTLIAYGDMRFTDPTSTKAANPDARRALVDRIAALHPDAVQLTGDIRDSFLVKKK